MSGTFEYTTFARSIAHRFPRATFVAIQINFWVISFFFLALFSHFLTMATERALGVQIVGPFLPYLTMSLIGGLFYGVALGFADQWIETHLLKSRSLGVAILSRAMIYFLVLLAMVAFSRYVVWEYLILPHYFDGVSPIADESTWKYYALTLMVFTLPLGFVISFINQMNKKFGPGVLIPLLLGRYRNPREEERVFMFMDLESSTTHAENLGHISYSSLIRDSFSDINRAVLMHRAEVYQYVGDEVVLSWPVNRSMSQLECLEFFFSCRLIFDLRRSYYEQQYGFVPRFKAGLHQGVVTAVEVGDIKRDIAYHGDTINTASRIQAKCRELGSDLLISGQIEGKIRLPKSFEKKFVGEVSLRGKGASVHLFSVRPRSA